MAITLRNVSGVSSVEEFRPEAAVRSNHGHIDIALDNILPFVCVGVPVQLAECARFEVENYAGDRGRDWKSGRINAPFAAAFEHPMRRLGKHPKLVRLWWSNAGSLQIFWYLLRRNGTAAEVN